MTAPAIEIRPGSTFGRMTVLCRAANHVTPSGKSHVAYVCRCNCGKERVVIAHSLRAGTTKSCGCLIAEETSRRTTKHGANRRGKRAAEYGTWAQMRSRCNDPHSNNYDSYGGRGISVCARWDSFANFLADMGPRPPGHSIDRIDVNGNYEPGNCRWADRKTQSRNTRRTTYVEFNGAVRPLIDVVAELGMSLSAVRARIRRGRTSEEAIR